MLAIAGSRSRAAILAQLFSDDARPRSVTDLARAAGVRHSAAGREVSALIAARLIRPRREGDPRPKYEADPSFPAFVELRRMVCLLTGVAARLRDAAASADARALVWIHGPYAELPSVNVSVRVAAISEQPRQMRVALHEVEVHLGRRPTIDAMSVAEWVSRLRKREMRVLAIRRAQRLWVLGDGEQLRRRERNEVGSRETLKRAIENWREELSDEWDEDFDPFARLA